MQRSKMASREGMVLGYLMMCSCVMLAVGQSAEDKEDCNLTTKRTLTVFKSLRFPEPYLPGLDCQYTVKRRSKAVCSVTFLFNVLDLYSSDDCEEDYLLFADTEEKICGSKPVGYSRTMSFESMANTNNTTTTKGRDDVTVKFHSSNRTSGGLGFMITVVQQECPRKTCDAFYDGDDDFVLTSPNYPMPYDNGRSCTFTIRRTTPAVCRLSLVVRRFELEEDDHCKADYLKLPDGRRLCGMLQPGQIVEMNFQNDSMILEFQSDHFTTANGFQLEARQVECLVTSPTTKSTITAKPNDSKGEEKTTTVTVKQFKPETTTDTSLSSVDDVDTTFQPGTLSTNNDVTNSTTVD